MNLPANPRVLFVSESHDGPYPYIFSRFSDGFRQLNCPITEINPAGLSVHRFKQVVEQSKPDVIFGLLRHEWAIVGVSRLLDEYHPTIALNWFQEDPNFVTASVLDASGYFDFWFTQDPRTITFWPVKAFFSPHAFDDKVYYSRRLTKSYDVSFIGQLGSHPCASMLWPHLQVLARFGKRALIATERPMGIPILPQLAEKILRTPKLRTLWQKLPIWRCTWRNPCDEYEKAKFVSQSKMHFGISRVRGPWESNVRSILSNYPFDKHGLFCQTKGRLLHATGCGVLAVNDYVPELEEMFDARNELVTFEFGDVEDLHAKLRYYATHDETRERIARRGFERAHRQHTFAARISQIFDCVRGHG
jgi:hypothetical protein